MTPYARGLTPTEQRIERREHRRWELEHGRIGAARLCSRCGRPILRDRIEAALLYLCWSLLVGVAAGLCWLVWGGGLSR